MSYGMGEAKSVTPIKQFAVPSAISDIKNAIEQLQKQTSVLQERLGPVLSNGIPEENKKDGPRPVNTPLVDELISIHEKIHDSRRWLMNLCERLEI